MTEEDFWYYLSWFICFGLVVWVVFGGGWSG